MSYPFLSVRTNSLLDVPMYESSAIRTASLCASQVAKPIACHPERSEGSRQLPMVQRLTNNCTDPSLRSG